MKRPTVKRIGIALTADDIKILTKLERRYGSGATAIIRIALRELQDKPATQTA